MKHKRIIIILFISFLSKVILSQDYTSKIDSIQKVIGKLEIKHSELISEISGYK